MYKKSIYTPRVNSCTDTLNKMLTLASLLSTPHNAAYHYFLLGEPKVMYATPVVRQALQVSARAHDGQFRKGGEVPYIVHPVSVALILAEFTEDEATLAAGLLHDVLEDCPDVYSEEQMREDFGNLITDTVKAVTKDLTITDWHISNEKYLEKLRASKNGRAIMVCAADKINNLTDTLEDPEVQTPEIWDKFTGSKEDQFWWYSSVYQLVAECMPNHPLTGILATLVNDLAVIVNDY